MRALVRCPRCVHHLRLRSLVSAALALRVHDRARASPLVGNAPDRRIKSCMAISMAISSKLAFCGLSPLLSPLCSTKGALQRSCQPRLVCARSSELLVLVVVSRSYHARHHETPRSPTGRLWPPPTVLSFPYKCEGECEGNLLRGTYFATVKDSPQPHEASAFGLWKTNSAERSSST